MSLDSRQSRQGLVSSWVAQLIGTLVLAGAALVFVRSAGVPFAVESTEWKRWAMFGILGGAVPALYYMRSFKRLLDADELAMRGRGGAPDPGLRLKLVKALAVGGALCEIPMAIGVAQLFFGGDSRWFLGATMITIALRLSYRPFNRAR
jgi:hypothetical protein